MARIFVEIVEAFELVEPVQIVQVVEGVHHRGQKSEIRDQL